MFSREYFEASFEIARLQFTVYYRTKKLCYRLLFLRCSKTIERSQNFQNAERAFVMESFFSTVNLYIPQLCRKLFENFGKSLGKAKFTKCRFTKCSLQPCVFLKFFFVEALAIRFTTEYQL